MARFQLRWLSIRYMHRELKFATILHTVSVRTAHICAPTMTTPQTAALLQLLNQNDRCSVHQLVDADCQ